MIHCKTHFGLEADVEEQTYVASNLWIGAAGRPIPGITTLDLRGSPLRDSIEEPVDAALIDSLADEAERIMASGPLMIGCTAGLNRSPLVAAVVLMRRGWSADEAISHMRKQRGDVILCNPTFEAWLRGREAVQ